MDFQENILEQFEPFENTLSIVSQILIALFFLIEMMSIGRLLHDSRNQAPFYIWIEIAIKYGVVALCVSSSSHLFEVIKWFTEVLGLKINGSSGIEYEFVVPESSPYFYKQLLTMFGDGIEVAIKSLQYYLLNIQKIEFTLLKLVAPFFISCSMIKSMQNLTKKYFHFTLAFYFQRICLDLTLKMLPKLFDLLKPEIVLSERLKDLLPSYISIIQGIMILMTIISSYYLPRKILSA